MGELGGCDWSTSVVADKKEASLPVKLLIRYTTQSFVKASRVWSVLNRNIKCMFVSQQCVARRFDKVPNWGLGPKWDQSAKMGPKSPNFASKSKISVKF